MHFVIFVLVLLILVQAEAVGGAVGFRVFPYTLWTRHASGRLKSSARAFNCLPNFGVQTSG